MPYVIPTLAAVLMWSALTWTSARLAQVPLFAQVGISFVIGGLIGLPRLRDWRVPLRAFAIAFAGIYGFHLLFFYAVAHGPAQQVALLNYLWPFAIILLSPLIVPGERLSWPHLGAAVIAYLGTVALSVAASGWPSGPTRWAAYAAAVAGGVVWAVYSLLAKRMPPTPSASLHGVCLACGLASLAIHAAQGGGFPALTAAQWSLLVVRGVFPMGLAYVCWDAAMKRGDPKVIALLSYLISPLSMLWLVLLP